MLKNIKRALVLLVSFSTCALYGMHQQLYPSKLTYTIAKVELTLSSPAALLVKLARTMLMQDQKPIDYSVKDEAHKLVAAAVHCYTIKSMLEELLVKALITDSIFIEAFLYCLPEEQRSQIAELLLFAALKYKQSGAVNFFIDLCGFSATFCDKEGNSLMHQLLLYNNDHSINTVVKINAIVHHLIARKANLNCENNQGETPLDILDRIEHKHELYSLIKRLLINNKARYGKELNRHKIQSIHSLLRTGDFVAARKIIEAGGLYLDEAYDEAGSTLVSFSTTNGFKNIVELLIRYGARPQLYELQNPAVLPLPIRKQYEETRQFVADQLVQEEFLSEAIEIKKAETEFTSAQRPSKIKVRVGQVTEDDFLLL